MYVFFCRLRRITFINPNGFIIRRERKKEENIEKFRNRDNKTFYFKYSLN